MAIFMVIQGHLFQDQRLQRSSRRRLQRQLQQVFILTEQFMKQNEARRTSLLHLRIHVQFQRMTYT